MTAVRRNAASPSRSLAITATEAPAGTGAVVREVEGRLLAAYIPGRSIDDPRAQGAPSDRVQAGRAWHEHDGEWPATGFEVESDGPGRLSVWLIDVDGLPFSRFGPGSRLAGPIPRPRTVRVRVLLAEGGPTAYRLRFTAP